VPLVDTKRSCPRRMTSSNDFGPDRRLSLALPGFVGI
jgi:hypothetical protein